MDEGLAHSGDDLVLISLSNAIESSSVKRRRAELLILRQQLADSSKCEAHEAEGPH